MTEQQNPFEQTSALITFQKFNKWLKYVVKYWYIVFIVAIVGACCGVLYAWLDTPKFKSQLTFALEEESAGLGGAFSIVAELGINIGSGKNIFSGDNITQIITSRRIIEEVLLTVDSNTISNVPITLAQFLINEHYLNGTNTNETSVFSKVKFPIGKPRSDYNYREDSILYVLYKTDILHHLTVGRPDKKLEFYELTFTNKSEKFAMIFTQRLISNTTKFYTAVRTKRSLKTLQVLESRVDAMYSNLNNSISSRAVQMDANINPSNAAVQAPQIRSQVDMKVYGEAYGELFKNLELARYQYLKDVPLLQIIDDVQYPLVRLHKNKVIYGALCSFLALLLCLVILAYKYYFKPVAIQSA